MSQKITTNKYILELKAINLNIICLDEYINTSTKIKHKCLKCNHIWYIRPANIKQGKGCPKCAGNYRPTTEDYMKQLIEKKNIKLKCLDEYINDRTKINHQCTQCGYIWKTSPSNVKQKYSCPKCAGVLKKTHEEYIEQLKLINPNVICKGKYQNNKVTIDHKCLKCNFNWLISPSNVLRGYGCPRCNLSKGEIKIINLLKENNIPFINQFRYKDLFYFSNKRKLSFDFYIPYKNLLIEYNGKQHYEPIEYFGGNDAFKHQQNRDKLKVEYCKKNNINLLVIKYDEDIEKNLRKNRILSL